MKKSRDMARVCPYHKEKFLETCSKNFILILDKFFLKLNY